MRTTCDLADLDNFVDGETPWRMFAWLREHAPVSWQPEEDGSGFWAVTRHADVVRVLRDEATFSSASGAALEELDADQLEIRRSMLETDGPRHRELRGLLHRDFAPRALAIYSDFLRGLARSTVDRAVSLREFDLVREVSAELPIRVLARMLDAPDADTDQLVAWGNRMIGNTDPEYADVLLGSAESERYRDVPFRSPAALEVFSYGRAIAEQRRSAPGHDLVTKLVDLDDRDFRNYFLLLVVAGNETTRHAITHGVKALAERPAVLAALRADPELIPAAVEEMLRWGSPVYHFRRTATRDVELHDQRIRTGDKVVVWLASANRDAAVFTDPDHFQPTRAPNDHLTFGGGGPHYCLGAALARMELRILFDELLPRVASIEATGPARWIRSNFVHGIKEYPVLLEAPA